MFAGEQGASCCVDWCRFPFHYFRMLATCYQEANYQRLFKRHISEYWDSSLIQGVMFLPFLSSLFHPQTKALALPLFPSVHLWMLCLSSCGICFCAWRITLLLREFCPLQCHSSQNIRPGQRAAKCWLIPVVHRTGNTPGENRTNIWFCSKETKYNRII